MPRHIYMSLILRAVKILNQLLLPTLKIFQMWIFLTKTYTVESQGGNKFQQMSGLRPYKCNPWNNASLKTLPKILPVWCFLLPSHQFQYLWKIWSRNSMTEEIPKTHPHNKERLTALALTHINDKMDIDSESICKTLIRKIFRHNCKSQHILILLYC